MIKKSLCSILLLLLATCITPEEPKYEYKDGLVYVDAFASTTPGTSYVVLSKSNLDFDIYRNEFISGANITLSNDQNGTVVNFLEENGIYLPPVDFVVSEGETWQLQIELSNGSKYLSKTETIIAASEFSNLKVNYDPELVFDSNLERFLPGHTVLVDITEPLEERSFYLYKYRSFERIQICETCENQIFRNGKCIDPPNPPEFGTIESDYYCDGECWRIRHSEKVNIFSDEFTQTGTVSNLAVGEVLLYTKENILVEVQQLSLNEESFNYYKILKDIVENSSGLNAPPPAPLIGNIYNPDDDDEYVLGRFTAASSNKKSIFINRDTIAEGAIEPINIFESECEVFCGVAICSSPESCEYETIVSCGENRYRTAIKPEAWVD